MNRISCLLIGLVVIAASCREKPASPGKTVPKDTNTTTNIPVNPGTPPANPYAVVDISPMDMSYYPPEYPKLKMANSEIAPPVMRVIYSRPHLGGRHLFDQVLKYGEPWRLGANESTEIQFYREVSIQGKKIKPGRYVIYCIPQQDKWTIALNTYLDSWGLKQEPQMDVQRFDVTPFHEHGGPSIEFFTLVFEKAAKGANLIIAWGDIQAKLPIDFD